MNIPLIKSTILVFPVLYIFSASLSILKMSAMDESLDFSCGIVSSARDGSDCLETERERLPCLPSSRSQDCACDSLESERYCGSSRD